MGYLVEFSVRVRNDLAGIVGLTDDDRAAVAVAHGRVTVYPDKGDSIVVNSGRRLAFTLGEEPTSIESRS